MTLTFNGIRIWSSRQSDNEPSDIMLSVHDIDVVAQSQNAIPTSILETKCVGDNFETLVTILAVFNTNILDFLTLASGTNIQHMSPISKFCHKHPKSTTSIKSPSSNCHQHLCFPAWASNSYNDNSWIGVSYSVLSYQIENKYSKDDYHDIIFSFFCKVM